MKNLIIVILVSLSFTIKAQTVAEHDMLNVINEIRVSPKSFIPYVEAFIKKQEASTPVVFTSNKVKISKASNDGTSEKMIAEAKALIVFLNGQKHVKALSTNLILYYIAKNHAKYLDSTKTVSHDGPNGQTLANRTKVLNVSVLENVCSVKANGTNTVIDAMLQFLLDYGVANKPHRANLFNEKNTQMAVAKVGDVWVQDFIYTLK